MRKSDDGIYDDDDDDDDDNDDNVDGDLLSQNTK